MNTKNVGLKLQATRSLVARLNPARRTYWTRLLDAAQSRARVRVGGESEWDLDLANWLDRVYTSVSDEATRVRKEASAAVADTASQIGFGVWPLALAALAVGYALSMSKRRV
jgi:hypothetical protein